MDNSEDKNLSAAFAPGAECVSIDELTSQLDGRRGEPARRNAEQHLAGCLHCRTELALLKEFESPVIRPEEQHDVKWIVARLRNNSPAAPVPWWRQMWNVRILAPASIALAAALIAIGIGLHMQPSSVMPVPAPGREVMRSQTVDVITPLGDLPTAPTELHWRAVNGAAIYRVRLLEVDRTEIWSATTTNTSVVLSDAVRRRLVPPKSLMWDVAALNSAGNLVASSGLQVFHLQKSSAH